ncbi:MAG: molybdopterin-guanine dinucleotide biosynthesis protein B [Dehalococcoidia bacterium]
MAPIVCIAGRPKAGKTTLIEKLIPELKTRGHRVATIKHTSHDFQMDTEGKDSFKHARAGSDCVVLSSAGKLALLQNIDHDPEPAELARLISGDFNIVLAEGFKKSKEPKIEVHRGEGDLVCPPDELMAVVSSQSMEVDVPRYSPEDIAGLATLIEDKIIGRKEKIAIFADGRPIPLKAFIINLYYKVILDLVLPLKGVGKAKRIDIWMKR